MNLSLLDLDESKISMRQLLHWKGYSKAQKTSTNRMRRAKEKQGKMSFQVYINKNIVSYFKGCSTLRITGALPTPPPTENIY